REVAPRQRTLGLEHGASRALIDGLGHSRAILATACAQRYAVATRTLRRARLRPRKNQVRVDEYELEEIKREIVESRSLTIKTNNLVNALAADLKSIAKRQQNYERRIFFNSATAYVVVVAVLMILTKVAIDAQVESVRAQGKDTRDELAQLEKELEAIQARDEARTRASRKAADYSELIVKNSRREIVKRYADVSKLQLTKTERA